MVALDGRTQSIADWSRELGIPYEVARMRVARGIPLDAPYNSKAPHYHHLRRPSLRIDRDWLLPAGHKRG